MPDFLSATFANDPVLIPSQVFLRLVVALILGGGVAWLYRHTRWESEQTVSFPPTLVLITILISVVTQVVGGNSARAFSLVGTLSIVRFRTVVRDTQDTAFVIFGVVVGMAAGAGEIWAALLCILVVGAAAFVMKGQRSQHVVSLSSFKLRIRTALGVDLDTAVRPTLDEHLAEHRLLVIGTAKQGSSIEVSYDARFRKNGSPDTLVKSLNRIDGVQDVELAVHEDEEDDD